MKRVSVVSSCLFFCLLAVADAGAASPSGLVVVSDYVPPGKIRFIDPARNTIVYDYYPDTNAQDECKNPDVVCVPMGFEVVNHDGQDYLDLAVSVEWPTAHCASDTFYSYIKRVKLGEPSQEIWRIRTLDFSDIEGGDAYCIQDSTSPTEAQTDPRCQLTFTHGFTVVDDRPDDQIVSLIIADTAHSRVLQATLDYADGRTYGHVDWVLGETNSDWSSMAFPNAVRYYDEGADGKYLMVTLYSESLQPMGGGMILMYQWTGTGWDEAWQFPDPRYGEAAHLNTPHGGAVLTDPISGERLIWYSHSRGLATDWREMDPAGFCATWGMLEPGESLADKPVYYFDATISQPEEECSVRFTRDQAFLPDGTLLLADSGCETMCQYTPRIYRTNPFYLDGSPSSAPGFYSPDHAELDLLEVASDDVLNVYECGLEGIFEMRWLDRDSLGQQLEAKMTSSRRQCPGRSKTKAAPGTGKVH